MWRPPSNGVSSKTLQDLLGELGGDDAGADRQHVGVVVLAGRAGRCRGRCRARRARRAPCWPRSARPGRCRRARCPARRRRARPRAPTAAQIRRVVDRLRCCRCRDRRPSWPQPVEHPDEMLLEREAGVVAADGNAHRGECTRPGPVPPGASGRLSQAAVTVRTWTARKTPAASHRRCCAGPTTCAAAGSRASTRAASARANQSADARFAVSNRLFEDAQPRARRASARRTPEAFVEPKDLEPEQRALYRAAARGYLDGVRGSSRPRHRSRLADPPRRRRRRSRSTGPASRSISPTAAASCACCTSVAAIRHAPARPVEAAASRCVRTEEWAPDQLTIVAADVIEQELIRDTPDLAARARRSRSRGSPSGSSSSKELAADGRTKRRAPIAPGCPFIAGCDSSGLTWSARSEEAPPPRHRVDHAVELRRLRAVRAPVLSTATCSACPRAMRAAPNETGLLVHDMLRRHPRQRLVPRHRARRRRARRARRRRRPRAAARRAPRAALPRRRRRSSARTRSDRARFHRLPPPMFMATARIDAIWIHDGLLDARDYKTGSSWHERVADVPRRRCRRSCSRRRAQRAGCGCGSATST